MTGWVASSRSTRPDLNKGNLASPCSNPEGKALSYPPTWKLFIIKCCRNTERRLWQSLSTISGSEVVVSHPDQPTGETVKYFYDSGGLVNRVHGNGDQLKTDCASNITYDKFGQPGAQRRAPARPHRDRPLHHHQRRKAEGRLSEPPADGDLWTSGKVAHWRINLAWQNQPPDHSERTPIRSV